MIYLLKNIDTLWYMDDLWMILVFLLMMSSITSGYEGARRGAERARGIHVSSESSEIPMWSRAKELRMEFPNHLIVRFCTDIMVTPD